MKTVNIQVYWAAHPGHDHRLLGVVTSKIQGLGEFLLDLQGSDHRVAPGSLSTATPADHRRRKRSNSMYKQAYVSSRCIGPSTAQFERSFPWSQALKRCLREVAGPSGELRPRSRVLDGKRVAPGFASNGRVSR